MGYYQAGFEVVGVDIEPQPHYPFEFHEADALTYPLEGFDAYHASPPCQPFSKLKGLSTKNYPNLITLVRDRLLATNKPFVIENVPGSPLVNPLLLCGTMFGLKVKRHRLFECHPPIYPLLPSHGCRGKAGFTNAYRGVSSFRIGAKLLCVVGHNFSVSEAREAMGIGWMGREGLREAIPPAMAQFIGLAMMEIVLERKYQ